MSRHIDESITIEPLALIYQRHDLDPYSLRLDNVEHLVRPDRLWTPQIRLGLRSSSGTRSKLGLLALEIGQEDDPHNLLTRA